VSHSYSNREPSVSILSRLLRPAALGLFALFALIAFARARVVFAQDAGDSADADASINAATTADSAGPGDAVAAGSDSSGDWQRVNPDLSAESAEKVLELPQTACVQNGVSIPCDERIVVGNAPGTGLANDNSQDNQDDGTQAAGGGGSAPASPQTFDEDTASAAPTGDSDWGTADDYANQQPIYGIPYGSVASRGPIYGNPQIPPSMVFPFPPAPISSPITQAARPPLRTRGPWMTPPSMMIMSRPAGSPMAGGAFRFH
jgi:hypothetical protein